MDAFECIATKLDVRDFSSKKVPPEVKMKVLEAARLTGSGVNRQHWRFILAQDSGSVKQLAKDSTSGSWVAKANFAVIVLTDPKYGFHKIDAGRAVQDMQLAAWNFGVVSCIYTGVNEEALRKDFEIPKDFHISVIAGFGYPARRITGKRKNRKPLGEVAFLEKYGGPLDLKRLQ
ncbi:MAG TPA: nitroreductase family protein [Candidatus Bathyarchaeia archaeon]|nr:nitroreductase family protein [Candidatus Bathyarchaeia archaeon]